MKANRKDLVTKRFVRQTLEKALQEAGLMSNVCFNLKHKDMLEVGDREILKLRQEAWDKAKQKLPGWMYRKHKGAGAHG